MIKWEPADGSESQQKGELMPQNNRPDSLSYIMTRAALEEKSRDPAHGISDRDTKRTYKAAIKRFCRWAKSNNYTREEVLTHPQDFLQAYTDDLVGRGLSPATIHTYLAAPCKGLKISMQLISKPERAIDAITRSRGEKNMQGRKDTERPQFARLMAFQSVVGLRRAELAHLYGSDLQRLDGVLYVIVRQGKGGKEQWQRVLPADAGTVTKTFEGIHQSEKVFTSAELHNKIDLHGLRAAHARACYDYYADRIRQRPEYREQLREELLTYFKAHHDPGRLPDQASYDKFCQDMSKNRGVYQMRGEARKLAEQIGRPTTYDRVALMAVSAFHLAHWRLDVTVTNYLTSS